MTPEARTKRSRDLRQRETLAEKRLWQALRGGRLGGMKFRRQHSIDRYFADFACEKARPVIELDGAVHDSDDQHLNDYHRQAELERLGWFVLRFQNADVLSDIQKVLDAIQVQAGLAGAETPHPPTR